MTKMAGVTQEKAWFRKSLVCSSLKKGDFKSEVENHGMFPIGDLEVIGACFVVQGSLIFGNGTRYGLPKGNHCSRNLRI